jgi:hypothetical protein
MFITNSGSRICFFFHPGSRGQKSTGSATSNKNPLIQGSIGLNVPTPAYNNTGSISPDEKPLSRLVFTKYALYLPP